MKIEPKNREELEKWIKEIIENQKKNSDYPYGLRDIDTRFITDMSKLFICSGDDIEYWEDVTPDTDGYIDWSNPKNDITNWNVSNVTNMSQMFYNAPFNQPIGGWNVSKVTDMSEMFFKTPFNRDISNWDISNVKNMSMMIAYTPFDKDISSWIDKMKVYCDLEDFNYNSTHIQYYGSITKGADIYYNFIENKPMEPSKRCDMLIQDVLNGDHPIKLMNIVEHYNIDNMLAERAARLERKDWLKFINKFENNFFKSNLVAARKIYEKELQKQKIKQDIEYNDVDII